MVSFKALGNRTRKPELMSRNIESAKPVVGSFNMTTIFQFFVTFSFRLLSFCLSLSFFLLYSGRLKMGNGRRFPVVVSQSKLTRSSNSTTTHPCAQSKACTKPSRTNLEVNYPASKEIDNLHHSQSNVNQCCQSARRTGVDSGMGPSTSLNMLRPLCMTTNPSLVPLQHALNSGFRRGSPCFFGAK